MKFKITGQHSLKGEIEVGGAKNAATSIIAATLLIQEECILDNVPRITDVIKMLEILEGLGAQVKWTGDHELKINTQNASLKKIDEGAVKSMRSSILLTGPLLSRFGKITIPEPGGCIIGNRPLDTHFYGLKKLGTKIDSEIKNGEKIYKMEAKELRGTQVVLPEFSVTATENIIMAAVLAKGRTVIKLAAQEPHVQDLVKFLDAAGAKIEEKAGNTIIIDGVKKLRGVYHSIIPDQIESGTFAVAAALMGRGVVVSRLEVAHLDIVLLKLEEAGVKFEIGEDRKKGYYLKILPPQLRAKLNSFKIQTMPYPGFPTDLQAPFSLLATQCEGISLIHDPLYESRMSHIEELKKMGARAFICDPHRVIIFGPTKLYGREIVGFNLRAGITLVIAGLVAEGETIIQDAEVVDRGYEKIDERLLKLGAKIKRI